MFEVIDQQIEKLQVIQAALQDLRLEYLALAVEDVAENLELLLEPDEESDYGE